MNKLSKRISLVAAILTIVAGSIFFVIAFVAFIDLLNWRGWGRPPLIEWLLIGGLLAVSASAIAFGIVQIVKRNFASNIANLVFASLFSAFMLYFVIQAHWIDGFLAFIFVLAHVTLGFQITSLVLRNKNVAVQQKASTSTTSRIELLKSLHAENSLTDAEFKTLLMKELEK